MDPLIIEPTKHTPKIILDNQKGIIAFIGKSRPEDAMIFYKDIHEWLNKYIANPQPTTLVKFELEYFNSSSAKHIKHILSLLKKIKTNGYNLIIEWYYLEDDEDMKDQGEEYAALIEIPFVLKAL